MKIKSIGIIGGTQGLGARFAGYFEQKFPELEVMVSGRKTKVSNTRIVQCCDLVIFAVPISVTEQVIEECLPFSREDQIWTDFTSVKQQPVKAMLQSKSEVCGLHPLFGPLPNIEGQTLIYCPERISEDSLDNLLKLLGAFDLMAFSPKEHDDLMGIVQCASHMSDMVMGETLKNSGFGFETIWKVSSPSYRLKLEVMGRMFAQNPDLYADIATQNLSAPQFTNLFKRATDDLESTVANRDRERLIKKFDQTTDFLTPEFCEKSYNDSQSFLSNYTNKPRNNDEKIENQKAEVGIFGEPFSHTDEASSLMNIKGEASRRYFSNIFEVFDAVENGTVESGILPYENSREGSVFQTLDGLFEHPNIQIIEKVKKPIQQNLLGISGANLATIKTIISHPQALAQSKEFIRANFADITLKQEASTAVAGGMVQSAMDPSIAAIGSELLAQKLGLEVVQPDIQGEDNYTSFIRVARDAVQKSPDHVSFVFWFTGDKSGNLAQVLSLLASHKINLVKLDSRRASKEYGHYLFFIDAEADSKFFETIYSEIESMVGGLRILGGY